MALNLIIDRTNVDVTYAQSMKGKKWANFTEEQKVEYLLGLKGAYCYIDFNRVENAVAYLSDLLKIYGYSNTVNIKTNWTAEDMQKVSEIQRYINNIAELKNKYYSNVEGTMPTTATWLTVEGANYLEKLLVDIEQTVIGMTQNYIYCGVPNMGQERIWQQRFRRPKDYTSTYPIDKYSATDTVRLLTTANTTHTGKYTSLLHLPQVEMFDDVGGSIVAFNKAFNDLDSLIGGVTA